MIASSAILGAAIALLQNADRYAEIRPTASVEVAHGSDRREYTTPAPNRIGGLSEVIARYEAVAGLEYVDDVEARILAAAEMPRSFERDTELEALFARLFEIDPLKAADLATDLDLPLSLLASIFRAWADVDLSTAVELIDRTDGAAEEMELALAILENTGYDENLRERLIERGRTLDSSGLEVASLARLSAREPAAAVAGALRLTEYSAQELAVEQIARTSGRVDPLAALAAGELISDFFLRHEYQVAVFEEWASVDVAGFLDKLAAIDPRDPWITNVVADWGALDVAAAAAPTLVLDFAAKHESALADAALAAALEALAEDDPAAALSYYETLATQRRSDSAVAAVAAGFARADLDGAVAWVTAQRPPHRAAAAAVITELASIDLDRAVELELATGAFEGSPPTWLMVPYVSDLRNPAQIAERVAAAGHEARSSSLLQAVIMRWVDSDPYAALTWLRGKGGGDAAFLTTLAERVGRNDLNGALTAASAVAPELRAAWIQQAVVGRARYDLEGAFRALERFRDEPFFAPTISAMLRSTAPDPRLAAELLHDAPLSALDELVFPIASRWASSDAPAAAAWAVALPDLEIREKAVRAVLQGWTRSDVVGASAWARTIRDDGLREAALSYICRQSSRAPHC